MNRRRSHFIEGAVHAVTNFELLLEGFEVNVAGAFLDRLLKNEIDELDDGGRVGLRFGGAVSRVFAELSENVINARCTGAVVLLDEALHLAAAGDDGHDRLFEPETKILDELRVQRVGEGDMQSLSIERDRKRAVETSHAGGDECNDGGRRLEILQVEMVGPQFLGHLGPEFVFGVVNGVVEQDLNDVLSVLHAVLLDIVGETFVDHSPVLKHVNHVLCGHSRRMKLELFVGNGGA